MQNNIIDKILQQATEARLENKYKKENQGSQTSGSAEIVAETMKHEDVPRTAKNVTDVRKKSLRENVSLRSKTKKKTIQRSQRHQS